MSSQWLRVVGSQFAELNQRRLGTGPEDAPTNGQSQAVDVFTLVQATPWLSLTAAHLNLPGAQIADAFSPEHGWAPHGDRAVINAIDQPPSAGELNILSGRSRLSVSRTVLPCRNDRHPPAQDKPCPDH